MHGRNLMEQAMTKKRLLLLAIAGVPVMLLGVRATMAQETRSAFPVNSGPQLAAYDTFATEPAPLPPGSGESGAAAAKAGEKKEEEKKDDLDFLNKDLSEIRNTQVNAPALNA